MQSLRYLYRIGNGPSSSHTMGPIVATKRFLESVEDADKIKVILYGSLAKTGKGHMTDIAIQNVLGEDKCEIVFDFDTPTDVHPNTLDFIAYKDGEEIKRKRFFSIGGGEVLSEGEEKREYPDVYPHNSFTEIAKYCEEKDIRIWQYVEECEGKEIWNYLAEVWQVMLNAVARGVATEGVLHGGLGTQRKAKFLRKQSHIDESEETKMNRLICAYAFAVSEENASGGIIATAPTCGACGVMPAVLKYLLWFLFIKHLYKVLFFANLFCKFNNFKSVFFLAVFKHFSVN